MHPTCSSTTHTDLRDEFQSTKTADSSLQLQNAVKIKVRQSCPSACHMS